MAEILNAFFELYSELGSQKILELYRKRMFLIGKKVKVLSNDSYEASILDVNPDFSLLLKLDDGKTINLNTREVSVKAI